MTSEEEKKRKRREYAREYRRRKKEEKWAKLKTDPETGIAVGQLDNLNRGHDGTPTVKHGFYRKKLTAKEARLADELHQDFYRRYDLDPLVDDMLLQNAITNFVKSLRKEPVGKDGDKNVRSYQAFYEREFRQIIDSLGLSRKVRKETDKSDDVARALADLFGKKKQAIEKHD